MKNCTGSFSYTIIVLKLTNFFELLLLLFSQGAVEAFVRRFFRGSKFSKKSSTWRDYIIYTFLGAMAACISLATFRNYFIKDNILRIINLILVPPLVGYLMHLWGKFLRNRQKKVLQLDSFLCGALFAFSFALVRFFYAK